MVLLTLQKIFQTTMRMETRVPLGEDFFQNVNIARAIKMAPMPNATIALANITLQKH